MYGALPVTVIDNRSRRLREHDHSADDQTTQRERRRKHLVVEYDERFTLSHEVAAILGDLPAKIMTDHRPTRWFTHVRQTVAPMMEALAAIANAVRRPATVSVELTAESITSGSWAVTLVDIARELDAPLSAVLAQGRYADALPTRLRDIDRAVATLAADVDRVQRAASDAVSAPTPERLAVDAMRARHAAERHALADKHRAELQALRRA